jgi:tetrahydromethanopterin S-methyltransferase subunit G
VTKGDMHADINRVLTRLDRLESKIDDFMKEQRSALG